MADPELDRPNGGRAESPAQRFHTGNLETLRRTDQESLAKEIRQFFNTHYCPPRMRLVTFGSASLESQLEQAMASFGKMSREGQGCEALAPTWAAGPPPFPSSTLRQMLRMQGLTPKPELHLVFPMTNLQPWVRSNPTAYLEHILLYAGGGSLLLAWRDQLGVASSLAVSQEDSSAGSKIIVSMALLPEGVERLPELFEAFFAFVGRARARTREQKLAVLGSLQESAQLGYDWAALQEASRAASQMANDMTKLAASDLLVAENLILDPDVDKIDRLLERLRPEGMLAILVDAANSSFWRRSPEDARPLPHYDVNYTVRPLELAWPNLVRTGAAAEAPRAARLRLDQHFAEVSQQLSLEVPGVIAGLPHVAEAAPPAHGFGPLGELWGELPKPLDLQSGRSALDVWHRPGWMLRQPRVTLQLTLRRPQGAKEPTAAEVVTTEMGLRILNELMSIRLAKLVDLGTTWKIETGPSSFSIHLSSFVGHAKGHFSQVLEQLTQPEEEAGDGALKRLRRLRRELNMEFEDQSEAVLSAAARERAILLTPKSFGRPELLEALGAENTSTSRALAAVLVRRSGHLAVTGLIMGNASKEEAKELQAHLLQQLGLGTQVQVLAANRSERVERVVRVRGLVELRARNPRGDHSHAMLMTLLAGAVSLKQRVLLALVSEVLNQVAFAVLRTQLQLGYVVGASVSSISNVLTVTCYVQSEVATPDVAEEHCEKVLAGDVVEALEALSAADFASIKESFRLQLLQPPLSTGDEMERFWGPIALGRCSNSSEEMLQYLQTVQPSDVATAWSSVVMPQKVREKVVIKLFGTGVNITERPETKVQLPAALHARLARERANATVLLGAASTKQRQALLSGGAGFYPQRLSCSVADPEESSDEEADEAKPTYLRREAL